VRGSEHFELSAPQVLPIVNFRVKLPGAPPGVVQAANEAVAREATRDGRRWISTTFVRGRSTLRMMVISYLTEERHLTSLENALTVAARQLTIPVKA
jgi:glutamate/tyrosine decarboxylase-like PLP-dependent enzyme